MCVCLRWMLFLSIQIQQKATTTALPSPKRATMANGFKQYLIISVIQRQLRRSTIIRKMNVWGALWT